MSLARDKAIQRLAAIRDSVSRFQLQDKPLLPEHKSHNAAVRILRNGLAVQCFNVFEDFLRARSGELLQAIGTSPVAFRHLPPRLQQAATLDAIKALNFQLRLAEKVDRIAFIQRYSAKVASTTTTSLDLADISFFHDRSNIDAEQLSVALKAFAVSEPWTQMSGLCSRLGLAGVPAKAVLTSFAQRRHTAAHDAGAAVSESDLVQSVTDAGALAVCFDILATRATSKLVGLRRAPPGTYAAVGDHRTIPLRTIRPFAGEFAERKVGNRRNTRRAREAGTLVPAAVTRARREGGAVVVYGAHASLAEWHL